MANTPENETNEISVWLENQMIEAKEKYPNRPPSDWHRLEGMFEVLEGKKKPKFQHPSQRPYSFYLPDLPFHTFWPKEKISLTALLESNYEIIREELLHVLEEEKKGKVTFSPYEGDGEECDKGVMVSQGDWRVLYFYRNFVPDKHTFSLFPKLGKIISQFGPEFLGGMVCFSSILPGTHIIPHTGPSNMRLTCHLGIVGCSQVEIRVGNHRRCYEDGKCVVFDDSFIHEVLHNGSERRVTLMLDCWHPSVTQLEKSVWSDVMKNVVRDSVNPDKFFHSMGLYDIRDTQL